MSQEIHKLSFHVLKQLIRKYPLIPRYLSGFSWLLLRSVTACELRNLLQDRGMALSNYCGLCQISLNKFRVLFPLTVQEDLRYIQSISNQISKDSIFPALSFQLSSAYSLTRVFSSPILVLTFDFCLNSCSHGFTISLMHRDINIQILFRNSFT